MDRASVVETPTGRFALVGNVPAELVLYHHVTGRPATPKQIAACRQVGPRIAGLKTRTWDSREAAQAALDAWYSDHPEFDGE